MIEQLNKTSLVSAIIIFLNAEKFIEEAIESVFAQTYENWELLLVDDGSTDNSTAIALQYAEKYPEKVRYLEHDRHQNLGMSATRNLGIRNAKGEYIALLDADDVWLPQKLERQLAIMESNPQAKVVCGASQYWYSWTGNPKDSKRDYIRELGIPLNGLFHPPKLLTLLLQNKINTPATCSVLIRRELFQEIGGFEESFRSMYEDQVFFTKVYLKTSVFIEPNYWDRYRQHPGSSCSIAEKTGQYHPFKINPADFAFLNWIAEYLSKEDVKDAEIWQALQKRFWPYHHPKRYFFLYYFQRIKSKLHRIGQKVLLLPIYH
ncbi:glycosyltransferase family 2 protein [Nostoc sp. CENA67]|uniref:Glycosyltransferase family 2 protein n=1 Tax=Amazonocrinis nigriterrae CENA67 TaxID=2794033 RepID=A0A8J7I0N8_9NOST|nr:glycosyltransferase family A protein [Amazonocrinis nigriterrae]MBH8566024.1 glycosyltransferase family 2 protein [Amazonocrinis nigriterrae CENA67]